MKRGLGFFTFSFRWIFLIPFIIVYPLKAQDVNDTVKAKETSFYDQITGFEERVIDLENSLYRLTKIRFSGYIQAQWQYFENPSIYPNNSFSIPRARIKIKYQPYSGVAFVLEPDFAPGKLAVKEAYACLNDPWLNTFSFTGGQFKKFNYENEISSSALEVLTRSMVVESLYPSEYGIGIKGEVNPPELPFHIQLGLVNGNEYLIITDSEGNDINPKIKDFDPYKDIMGRFVYNFLFGNRGGIDIGVSGYYGWIRSNSTVQIAGDYSFDRQVTTGQSVPRRWIGAEMQLYLDILGGFALKGECLMGLNAYPGYTGTSKIIEPTQVSLIHDTLFISSETTNSTMISPVVTRNFIGSYIYLIKNIGKKNKFAFRWDYYDPNTRLKGNQIGVTGFDESSYDKQVSTTITGSDPVIRINETTNTDVINSLQSGIRDIAYHRFSVAWSYFVTENIVLQAAYEIPINEKVGTNETGEGNIRRKYTVNGNAVYEDYSSVFRQNVFTLRMQVSF
jgi:hypothetical protein